MTPILNEPTSLREQRLCTTTITGRVCLLQHLPMKWRVQWSNKTGCSFLKLFICIFKWNVFTLGLWIQKKNTLGIIACHISAAINPAHWWTFRDLAVLVSVKTLGRIHPTQLVNLDIVAQFYYLAYLSLKCLIVHEVKKMPYKVFRRKFWKLFHLISKHNAKQGRSPSKGSSKTCFSTSRDFDYMNNVVLLKVLDPNIYPQVSCQNYVNWVQLMNSYYKHFHFQGPPRWRSV